jgi:hypothetical protein
MHKAAIVKPFYICIYTYILVTRYVRIPVTFASLTVFKVKRLTLKQCVHFVDFYDALFQDTVSYILLFISEFLYVGFSLFSAKYRD